MSEEVLTSQAEEIPFEKTPFHDRKSSESVSDSSRVFSLILFFCLACFTTVWGILVSWDRMETLASSEPNPPGEIILVEPVDFSTASLTFPGGARIKVSQIHGNSLIYSLLPPEFTLLMPWITEGLDLLADVVPL